MEKTKKGRSESYRISKNIQKDGIEINKIKVVLCALWDNQPHPDAQRIINQFKEEIGGILMGN